MRPMIYLALLAPLTAPVLITFMLSVERCHRNRIRTHH
jgi:hypothetical protein